MTPATEAVIRNLFESWTRWQLLARGVRDVDQLAGRLQKRFYEEYTGGWDSDDWMIDTLVVLSLEQVDWRHVAVALLRALARRQERRRKP